MSLTDTNRATLLCLPGEQYQSQMVPESMRLKSEYPERYFVYGGVVHAATEKHPVPSLGKQVHDYYDIGFDGIKMLEGKPSARNYFAPYRLDDAYYAEFFEAIQERDLPVTLQSLTPLIFGSKEKA